MHRRFASADRIHSARTEIRSPYAKNYRTNLTHDQRELLSHRQNVTKLQRRDLEDRYIALIDEHFTLKKDNAANHEKIKKLATKLLRISADGKQRGVPFPMQLAPNENLEIQVVKLESYNALLRDRLNTIIRRFGNGQRSASVTGLRPTSCLNLSLKRKLTISQDDLNLFDIPEPPSSVRSDKQEERKSPSKCKCKCAVHQNNRESMDHEKSVSSSRLEGQQNQQTELSIVGEKIGVPKGLGAIAETLTSPDGKAYVNDLKNTIQKLENDLHEVTFDSQRMARVNTALEERLTNEILSKRISENVELVELRRTVAECETELAELRREYLTLKIKTEIELDAEQLKINELTETVENEVKRNKILNDELESLKNATNLIESIHEETKNIQIENRVLKGLQRKMSSHGDDGGDGSSSHRHSNEQERIKKLLEKNKELEKLLEDSTKTTRERKIDIDSAKSSKLDADDTSAKTDKEAVSSEVKDFKTQKSPRQSRIPLEPHIEIVNVRENIHKNGNRSTKDEKSVERSPKKKLIDESKTEGQESKSSGSSAGGTYNITENKDENSAKQICKGKRHGTSQQRCKSRERRKLRHQETASEVSSIDSDDNYRNFKQKNRDMQGSLLLVNQHGAPLDFTSRLEMLEKAAYYQPLSSVSQAGGGKELTCNCSQSGCRRTNQSIYEDIHIAVENAKTLLLKEFKNHPLTDPNDSQTKSVSMNGGFDESSDCREFLRVQYNLNNLYRQELEFMCKSCKEQTDTLLNEIDNLKDKLRNYEEKIQALETVTSQVHGNGSARGRYSHFSRVLDISRDQGVLEIHVESFKLTKEGHNLLSCKHGEPGSLFFSWTFYNFESESRTSLRKGPAYVFQNACVYLVDIRRAFLHFIKVNQLEFRLLAEVGPSSIVVGKSMLNLSEMLIFPQNKIQLETKVMSVDNECASHMHSIQMCSCRGSATRRKHLGNLSVWFRLTCEMDVLKEHAEHLWMDERPPSHDSGALKSTRKKVKIRKKSENPVMSEQTSEQSSVDPENHDATDSDVIIAKQREGGSRKKSAPKPLQSNEIALTIESLVLLNNGDIMEDTYIRKLFVEYNFFGLNVSSSFSKSSSSSRSSSTTTIIPMNYRKVFRIKDSGHDQKCHQRFIRVLRNHEKSIKFIIATESNQEIRHNHNEKDHLELALGLLHLGKLVDEAETSSERETVRISIMSKNHPYKDAGFLELIVEGVDLLKNVSKTSEHS